MKTILLVLVFCVTTSGQGFIVATGGGNTSGLGSKAGGTIGFDASLRRDRLEFTSRFVWNFADKIGSNASSRTVTERALVRYGKTLRLDGGILVGSTRGVFGSRTIVAPLVGGSYNYERERYRFIPYAHARLYEWGTNYTREHSTKGIEGGIELQQRWSRLITTQTMGLEWLRTRNLSETNFTTGTYGFVRAGVGVAF